MPALYTEITLGASSYGQAGVTAPWPFETTIHSYLALGASGSDMYFSWDGVNDHGRVRAPGAAGVLGPVVLSPIAYRSVWLRSVAGITGTVGVGLYSR